MKRIPTGLFNIVYVIYVRGDYVQGDYVLDSFRRHPSNFRSDMLW